MGILTVISTLSEAANVQRFETVIPCLISATNASPQIWVQEYMTTTQRKLTGCSEPHQKSLNIHAKEESQDSEEQNAEDMISSQASTTADAYIPAPIVRHTEATPLPNTVQSVAVDTHQFVDSKMAAFILTNEFKYFSKLAPEIRTMIWEQAMPGPRVIEVLFEEDRGHFAAPQERNSALEQLLGTCRESRRLVLKRYEHMFISNTWIGERARQRNKARGLRLHYFRTYIDTSQDTVLYSDPGYMCNRQERSRRAFLICRFFQSIKKDILSNLQHISLPFWLWRDVWLWNIAYMGAVGHMTKLSTINVILKDALLSASRIRSRNPRPLLRNVSTHKCLLEESTVDKGVPHSWLQWTLKDSTNVYIAPEAAWVAWEERILVECERIGSSRANYKGISLIAVEIV